MRWSLARLRQSVTTYAQLQSEHGPPCRLRLMETVVAVAAAVGWRPGKRPGCPAAPRIMEAAYPTRPAGARQLLRRFPLRLRPIARAAGGEMIFCPLLTQGARTRGSTFGPVLRAHGRRRALHTSGHGPGNLSGEGNPYAPRRRRSARPPRLSRASDAGPAEGLFAPVKKLALQVGRERDGSGGAPGGPGLWPMVVKNRSPSWLPSPVAPAKCPFAHHGGTSHFQTGKDLRDGWK